MEFNVNIRDQNKFSAFLFLLSSLTYTPFLSLPFSCLKMVSTLSHHFLCSHSLQPYPLSNLKFQTLTTKPHCLVRLRTVPKSSPQKNSTTSLEATSSKPTPPQDSSSDDSFSRRFRYCEQSYLIIWNGVCEIRFVIVIGVLNRNEWLKFDALGMEILSIALPAALALAADPIASLVDTAFVGHIGNFCVSEEFRYSWSSNTY